MAFHRTSASAGSPARDEELNTYISQMQTKVQSGRMAAKLLDQCWDRCQVSIEDSELKANEAKCLKTCMHRRFAELFLCRTSATSTSAASYNGSFLANFSLGTMPASLLARYPAVDGNCITFDIETTASANLQSLFKMLAPSLPPLSASELNVPEQLLNLIAITEMSHLSLASSSSCGNFSFSATFNIPQFGSATVGGYVRQVCTQVASVDDDVSAEAVTSMEGAQGALTCHWDWDVYIVPPANWDLQHLLPQGAPLPMLHLKLPVFVLSPSNQVVTLPTSAALALAKVGAKHASSMVVNTGLNFFSTLMINQSDSLLQIQSMAPSAVNFSGLLSPDYIFLSALLSQSAPLQVAPNVHLSTAVLKFNASFQNSQQVALTLEGAIDFPNPFVSSETVKLQAQAEIANSSSLDFSCSVSSENDTQTIHFDLGPLQLALNCITAHLNLTTVSGVTSVVGDLSVNMQIGGATLVSVVELLKGDVLVIRANLTESQALTFGDMITHIAGPDAFHVLPLPMGMVDAVEHLWAFHSASILFQSQPTLVNLTGLITLEEVADLPVLLSIQHLTQPLPDGSLWSYTMGLELGVHSISSALPDVKALDQYTIASCALVVSNVLGDLVFPGTGMQYNVQPGLNIVGQFSLAGSPSLQSFARIVGVTQASVTGVVLDQSNIELHANVQGDLNIFNVLHLTALGFFVRVHTNDVQLGLEVDSLLQLTNLPQDQLHLHDALYAATQGLGFDAAITKDWVNPLGINGLTFKRADLSMELSWEVLPVSVGVAGGLYVGAVGGQGAVWVDESGFMISGRLDQINLSQIIDSILAGFNVVPPTLVNTITNMGFRSLSFYANTLPNTLSFFGVAYAPGFVFDIQDLNLWNIIKGSAHLDMVMKGSEVSGLKLNATLQPINFFNGEIVISGAKSSSDPLSMYLSLQTDVKVPTINFSGGLELFYNHVAVQVVLTDSQFTLFFNLALFDNLLNFNVGCQLQGTFQQPTDFWWSTNATNRLQDYIANAVPQLIQQAKSSSDQKLQDAIDKVKQAQIQVDSLDQQIQSIRSEDEQRLSAAERAFTDAKAAVQAAQQRVDTLQGQINTLQQTIDNLPWYLKWEAVGYGTELAALWVAEKTATGVLTVAQFALDQAAHALGIIPSVDPRLLALEVSRGTAHAVLDQAIAFLQGIQKLSGGILTIVSKAAQWQGAIFNLQEFGLSGSLRAIAKGDLCQLHVKGMFLDRQVNFNVDVNLVQVQSMVQSIWQQVVAIFSPSSAVTLPSTWPDYTVHPYVLSSAWQQYADSLRDKKDSQPTWDIGLGRLVLEEIERARISQ